jgi:hypothetical protein
MNNNYLYVAYLNYINLDKNLNILINVKNNISYQIIGYYDKKTDIWYNGWSIYDDLYNNQYKKSKELLIYALNIEINLSNINNNIKMIIRYILTSSKIYIKEDLQLEIILSVITYLCKAKKIIYFNTNNISQYYIQI